MPSLPLSDGASLPLSEGASLPLSEGASLPLSEGEGARTRVTLRQGLFAVLALIGILTAGHTLGFFGNFGKSLPSPSDIETAATERSNKVNIDQVHSIDNSTTAAKSGSFFERELAHRPAGGQEFADRTTAQTSGDMTTAQPARPAEAADKVWMSELDAERERSVGIARDLITVRAELAKRSAAEAAARKELLQLSGQLEAKEKEWTTNLNAERERSDGIARELAAVRAALGDRVNAEAVARKELAEAARRIETNEKEWTANLNAERERSDGIARELAAVRAELGDRVNAEAVARKELAEAARRIETNEKEWTANLNAERERSDGIARELAAVRAELGDRVNAEAVARKELAEAARRLETNEKEWTANLNAERERSDGIARELAVVRAELGDRVNSEALARKELAEAAKSLGANEEWTTKLKAERERSDGIAKELASVRAELVSARSDVSKLTRLSETKEKEWTTKLNAERERSNNVARELVAVRGELADHAAEAAARKKGVQSAALLEANEKELTTKLSAERERFDGAARDLAALRAELAERNAAEQSARMEVAELARLLEASKKEWTSRLNSERERSVGIARDLDAVRAELADRVASEQSARTAKDNQHDRVDDDRPWETPGSTRAVADYN